MSIRHPVLMASLIILVLVAGCEGAQPSTMPVSEATPVSKAPAPTATPAGETMLPTTTSVSEAAPTVTPLPTLTGSGGGVIAFASDRNDGDWEIYVMNADGTDQRRLTNQRFTDRRHAWSPDGAQLAFTSRRKGGEDIYVMNADGSNPRRLTTNRANDFLPTWSPDGMQIAFVSDRDRNTEIYVMNADGSDQRRLTHNTVDDGNPDWSPAPPGGGTSGTQIAFVSGRDGNDEIYVMNADGAEQGSGAPRRLTHNDADDWWPAWSPDGTQIGFTSARDGSYEIYVMNVEDALQGTDGSDPRRLTHGDADAWWPSWSPDGTQIAFQSNPDGQWDIYVIDADGTNVRQLTTGGASDQEPAWRP
jgi:Tol biopolymer transport system component